MRRCLLLFTAICITLMLFSCQSTGKRIKPTKTEVVDFEITTATQMLEKGEQLIVDLSTKASVSRDEYQQFLTELKHEYNEYEDIQLEYIFFFNDEIENKQIETLRVNKDMFYPTIFHMDVEVVSAQIINNYYEEQYLNSSTLTIREEYVGEDSKLDNWYREYNYQKNTDDEWVFHSFGGQMNFSGEDFTFDYLKRK